MFKNRFFCGFLLMIVFFISIPYLSYADMLDRGDDPINDVTQWFTLKSDYFTIYYKKSVNLEKVLKNLSKRVNYYEDPYQNTQRASSIGELASRLDRLCEKACSILDMYPRGLNVKIRIFKNSAELKNAYKMVSKGSGNPISFYIYRYNTIYTSENHISDSVMSHEIGHAIVDNYFAIRPPDKIREVLSCYIDLHLDE